jgi:hypothetical protein
MRAHKAAQGEIGEALRLTVGDLSSVAFHPGFHLRKIRLVARNIPADTGAISPFTPASSNASFAAFAAKDRSLLALPFGMLHLFDRLVLTSSIRTFPSRPTL